MKILCENCKDSFEEPNLENDLAYSVKCPKCEYSFKIKTKRTKVVLPSYYKTSIEETSRDLIIEKKGDGLKPYLIIVLGFMLITIPIFFIIKTINSRESLQAYLPLILLFAPCLFFIVLGYCNIVNTTKFRIGHEGVTTSVNPYEWVSKIRNNHHKINGINQIFVKKQSHKTSKGGTYYMYHLYMKFHDGSDTEIGIFDTFDEARGLEILIEKRLGIEDKEISGEELA